MSRKNSALRSRSKLKSFLGAFFGYALGITAAAKCALVLATGSPQYGSIGVAAAIAGLIAIAAILIAQTLALYSRRLPEEIAGAVTAMLLALPLVLSLPLQG